MYLYYKIKDKYVTQNSAQGFSMIYMIHIASCLPHMHWSQSLFAAFPEFGVYTFNEPSPHPCPPEFWNDERCGRWYYDTAAAIARMEQASSSAFGWLEVATCPIFWVHDAVNAKTIMYIKQDMVDIIHHSTILASHLAWTKGQKQSALQGW